jgi:uncharacterized C2H2 Zn-finger protein
VKIEAKAGRNFNSGDSGRSQKEEKNRQQTHATPTIPTSKSKARSEDGTFLCLKCPEGENFTTEISFHDHVRNCHIWKEEEETTDDVERQSMIPVDNYWCPECDMEYAAKPSFEKHILFAHTYIQNINEYLDSIGYGKREKPVLENQCEVCRLKCASSLEYEGHIRSHGMAFLKLRQQRGST